MKAWLASLACFLAIAADDPKVNAQEKVDLDLMQGVWTRVSSESNGNKQLFGEPRPLLIVAGDGFTFGLNNHDPERVKLDPNQVPKAIDLTPTGDFSGPLKGKTYPGIYKIEGDKLILCLSIKPGSERPKKFDTVDNNLLVLDVYERSKPSAP